MENTTCQNNYGLGPNINSTKELTCNDNSSTGDQDLMQQVVSVIQGVIASIGMVFKLYSNCCFSKSQETQAKDSK